VEFAETWPLTGRDEELRMIATGLTGGNAGCLVLAGEAGVGKTRLAREALRRRGGDHEWVAGTRTTATIAVSLPSREIAARLGLSVRTVDNALGRVYQKLGIGGRAELAPILSLPSPRSGAAGLGTGRDRAYHRP
jgi:hypothetical protein